MKILDTPTQTVIVQNQQNRRAGMGGQVGPQPPVQRFDAGGSMDFASLHQRPGHGLPLRIFFTIGCQGERDGAQFECGLSLRRLRLRLMRQAWHVDGDGSKHRGRCKRCVGSIDFAVDRAVLSGAGAAVGIAYPRREISGRR